MKAVQYLGPKKLKIVTIKKPHIKANEILMQTKSVGICGTDLHIYKGGMNLPVPLTPGHEFSGVVAQVGSKVKKIKVGDRITAEHVVPCGRCYYCKHGKPNLCSHASIIGLHRPGALAEYVAIPADLVFKIPKKISFEEAALIEPLTIGMYALRNAGINLLGKQVAVVGQGPIGILIDQLLKQAGAYVLGIDILKPRLDFVKKKKWVDEVINAKQKNKIKQRENSFDISFEVVGRESTTQICLDLTRRDGDIFLLGVFEQPATINLMEIVKKELNLRGSWTCAFSFPASIKLVEQGKVDLKSLITHRYPFSKTLTAFKQASEYSDRRIKTVINF